LAGREGQQQRSEQETGQAGHGRPPRENVSKLYAHWRLLSIKPELHFQHQEAKVCWFFQVALPANAWGK
ncbi:MAG: hypothetical protein NZP74_05275, partial [Anaerolineales bacterium]|nr:hypothetical protein [Anaerolineales bacterium]